jgi:hypothetical protein
MVGTGVEQAMVGIEAEAEAEVEAEVELYRYRHEMYSYSNYLRRRWGKLSLRKDTHHNQRVQVSKRRM